MSQTSSARSLLPSAFAGRAGQHFATPGGRFARKIVEGAQLAWKWAHNVERWAEVPPAKRIEMRRESSSTVRAPTWEQMDRCVKALSGWSKRVGIVLRYSGLRIGEVMQLKWTDIDLDAATLTIRKEVDKSRRGRAIPISPYLVAHLRRWERDDEYIIRTGSTIRLRHRQPRAKDFRKAWQRAGVPADIWQRRPSRAFRKGFKSNLLALGVMPDAIDFLQGHKLGGGARERYIDPRALNLEQVVAAVPRIAKRPPPVPSRRTTRVGSPPRPHPVPPPAPKKRRRR